MSSIVLVHGAWHGAWCWRKVTPRLEASGHTVLTPDLPGLGADPTPPSQVTFEDYVGCITGTLERLPEPALLAGHSMAGMIISAVAERRPELVRSLAYLAAFLPASGESLPDIEARNPRPSVQPSLVVSEAEGTAVLPNDRLRPIFYHDCSEDDVRLAVELLRPQPLGPLPTSVALTEVNFGSVPRDYIECTDDRAICIALQRDMVEKSPCRQVYSLEAGHSPFFSKPDQLAGILSGIAAQGT